MTNSRATRPFPWVDIACLCHENELTFTSKHTSSRTSSFSESAVADSPGTPPPPTSTPQSYPSAIWDPFSRHPLESLYFCEHCHTHRCTRCVETEVVCRYCPQCLFEVTASSARSEGNRCVRSCFRCPKCTCGLMVVCATGLGQEETNYMLKCPHCEWNSQQEVGLTFPKSSSLVSKVQNSATRNKSQIDARFQAMREFYFERSLEEGMSLAASARRSLDGSGGDGETVVGGLKATSSTFAEILERRIRDKSRKDPGSEIYSDIIEVDEGADQSNAFLQALSSGLIRPSTNGAEIQRDLIDKSQGFPLPQPLRSKRTKRCRACHHMLVKPESKPSSTKFKIKLMALNYLPSLRLSPYTNKPGTAYPASLMARKAHTLLLTVTNPMQVSMKVVLSALPQDAATFPHKVTIVTPSVELGAASELWDEASLVGGVPSVFIKRESSVTKRVAVEGHRRGAGAGVGGAAGAETGASGGGGIHQRGRNWCTVLVEVVPSPQCKVLEVPLFVSFSFNVPKEEEEEEAEPKPPGQDEKASEDKEGIKGEVENKDKASEETAEKPVKEETVSIGFWAVLGVANIAS